MEACNMENTWMGYTIHKRPKIYQSSTILFSNEYENVTVQMIQELLQFMMSKVRQKNMLSEERRKILKVLNAFKLILENKTPQRLQKEEMKMAVDVIEEIKNENASCEFDIVRNKWMAILCKMMIEVF